MRNRSENVSEEDSIEINRPPAMNDDALREAVRGADEGSHWIIWLQDPLFFGSNEDSMVCYHDADGDFEAISPHELRSVLHDKPLRMRLNVIADEGHAEEQFTFADEDLNETHLVHYTLPLFWSIHPDPNPPETPEPMVNDDDDENLPVAFELGATAFSHDPGDDFIKIDGFPYDCDDLLPLSELLERVFN